MFDDDNDWEPSTPCSFCGKPPRIGVLMIPSGSIEGGIVGSAIICAECLEKCWASYQRSELSQAAQEKDDAVVST